MHRRRCRSMKGILVDDTGLGEQSTKKRATLRLNAFYLRATLWKQFFWQQFVTNYLSFVAQALTIYLPVTNDDNRHTPPPRVGPTPCPTPLHRTTTIPFHITTNITYNIPSLASLVCCCVLSTCSLHQKHHTPIYHLLFNSLINHSFLSK